MNTLISTKQLKYTVSGFIVASSLLTGSLYYFTKNDSWVAAVTGYLTSLVIMGIYSSLANRYAGLDLPEISEAVFGKIPGKAVTVLYTFYFLSLAYFNTRDLGDFVKGMLLPSTPMMIIFTLFLIVCAWAVRKGPVKMTRYGLFLTFVAVAMILINSILLINKINISFLMPVFTLPLMDYVIGTHIVTMLPYCEIIAFMMFIPHMAKPKEIGRALRGGLTIGGIVLLFVVIRDITVTGNFSTVLTNPTFSAIRLIDIGDILTRLEVLYAIILMMLLFLKVSVVYYATVSCIRSLFGTSTHGLYIRVFGVLIAVYAVASFPEGAKHMQWNLTAAATYSSFFIFVLPLATFIVSLIRSRPNRSLKPEEC